MAEKDKTLIDQIEKLIVNGNQEVLNRLGKLEVGMGEMKNDLIGIKGKVDNLDRKVDRIDNTLNATAQASYGLLTDVQKDVKEVKATLDKHVLLPAHA